MIGSWLHSGIPPNRILVVCSLHTPTLDLLGSNSFSRSLRPCILVVQRRELGPSCQASRQLLHMNQQRYLCGMREPQQTL